MPEQVEAPVGEETLRDIAREHGIPYERAKNLVDRWATGFRTGVAQTLGVKPEEVRVKKAWKREWFEDWLEALLGHSPGLGQILGEHAETAGEAYGITMAREKEKLREVV